MSYEVEKHEYTPKNFLAGDFPTVPEDGVAGAAIDEFTPIAKNDEGKIIPITADTIDSVIGISVEAAEINDPIVYYMTGEFFANAINLPEGVTIDKLKDALRKVSIFLKD
ncbi:MAG: hypothetical protein Q4D26_10345 [Clostridia bacterium]|nr:hypothetical protein [Clostridia bacterium]